MTDKKSSIIWNECKALTNREKNFAAMRAAIKAIDPPVIPYLGMYLTDLTFIDEVRLKKSNPNTNPNPNANPKAHYYPHPKPNPNDLRTLSHGFFRATRIILTV